MTLRLSDYAVAGDMRTGLLVHQNGSIDWWCTPRFDSNAVFSRLLGDEDAGFWQIAPNGPSLSSRSYRRNSLVLETTFETAGGRATLTDALVLGASNPTIVRCIEGIKGTVDMRSRLRPRMYYGKLTPWTQSTADTWLAVAAPDALVLRADAPIEGERGEALSDITIEAGQRRTLTLQWFPAHGSVPPAIDGVAYVTATERWWETWAANLQYCGPWQSSVVRSALTLKALTDRETGAMVAALTTSLPEKMGADRNWDYRYTWLRDASFGFASLNRLGANAELNAWCEWLLRVYAGTPQGFDIMYGVGGERLVPEEPATWLDGVRGSKPVRIGNDAHEQCQLGIVGDVLTALMTAYNGGWNIDRARWDLLEPLVGYLEQMWQQPGNGIWEVRGEKHHYVHSNAMAWRAANFLGAIAADIDPAAAQRADNLAREIHADVLRHGFSDQRQAFTEHYETDALDASVLLLALHDFLPIDDRRIASTVAAIERELVVDGYVFRYSPDIVRHGDRIETREGSFTMCGFWLVQVLIRQGRREQAERLFERLAATANDVGIFSEEYDVQAREAVGNLPQAFSHSGLIDAAVALYGSVSSVGNP